jgi:predicted nucleic acid-binding protein
MGARSSIHNDAVSRTRAVLDAGPIIAFHQIGRLDIVRDLFAEVITAAEVGWEVSPSLPVLPDWNSVHPVNEIPLFAQELDLGEQAVIALSVQMNATFAVLDDLDARNIAIARGIRVIGSLGLLARAKRGGLIQQVQPLMDEMIAHGLYASTYLYLQILTLADEQA